MGKGRIDNIHNPADLNDYGSVELLRQVLLCRSSQIDNPGMRECSWCPYKDKDGDCDDLLIARDCLNVINDLDIFNKKISEMLNAGYSLELSRIPVGS